MEKNKGKYKIIHKNKQHNTKEYFDDVSYNNYNEDPIKIKLIFLNNAFKASKMFCNCDRLISVLDNKKNKFNYLNAIYINKELSQNNKYGKKILVKIYSKFPYQQKI